MKNIELTEAYPILTNGLSDKEKNTFKKLTNFLLECDEMQIDDEDSSVILTALSLRLCKHRVLGELKNDLFYCWIYSLFMTEYKKKIKFQDHELNANNNGEFVMELENVILDKMIELKLYKNQSLKHLIDHLMF